jgi:hypothetical protein
MQKKHMADSRAMEEQMERMNPLDGRGATPSMGLSQIRGGMKEDSDSDDDAKEQGKALSEHLHKLHGKGYARSFHKGMAGGLGTGRYEGQGMSGGYLGLAMMALPLISKLLGAGRMTQEAHDRMKELIEEHEEKYHGKKMKGGYLGLAMMALPLISKLLGAGHMDEQASKELSKLFKKDMKGAGTGGMMDMRMEMRKPIMNAPIYPSPRVPPKMEMQGKGFLSDLGIPVVSDVAGMFGLGKRVVGGEKRVVGAGDGRKKRAEIVKRVMREKGLSMINASKYVKENSLY